MNAIVKQDTLRTDQIDLIKSTIANGASDNELKLFLYQCERTGLDPLAKQIYSIRRGGKMVTQIGIDGARLIAQRTGRYAGQDGPYWCGEDGVWRDVWVAKDPPFAAKVNVYLLGVERGTPGVAHWDEYAQKYQGKPTDMWGKFPRLMLAKCAEMLALRKAFPQELSGLYTSEEMGQADNVIDVTPQPLAPAAAPTEDVSSERQHDNPFEDASELDRHREQFQAFGSALYGAQWPVICKRNVGRITGNATHDANALTVEQLQKLIAGMESVKAKQHSESEAVAA